MSMRRGVAVFVCAGLALVAPAWSQTEDVSAEAAAAMPVARILPAVASIGGVGGSYFKTSVQLFNQYPSTLSGRLVFHRAGETAASDDPGLNITIASGETVSYDDVLGAMGLSGIGTLDILMPVASTSPIIVARVFNDAGDDGTSGFTEDVVNPNESGPLARVLSAGKDGYLVLPSDLEAFRFNLGIRVLSVGGWTQFLVFDAEGDIVADVGKSLSPYSFQQQEASAFLGVELPPGGSIRIRPTAGSVIVYGATVDNVTQDPSIQFARSGS
jgi:hypothetical protein